MSKKRILLIDDEVTFTNLVKLNLELTKKYEVCIESRGMSSLATAQKSHPHFVFLDICMPDINSEDIAGLFRKDAHLKDVPIVWLATSLRTKEFQAKGGKIAGFPFLIKPVGTDDFIAAIKQYLKN
jgi:DNA-binding response OmpR family regulator